MHLSLEERVRREVEDLHQFFYGWFRGEIDRQSFESKFLPRFAPDLVFIPPGGRLYGLPDLSSMIRGGYGSNPEFRVCIRKVEVRRRFDGHILATYEEWQRNARASQPADNGRIATVLFTDEDPLRWLHIHETWLPEDVMATGPYDF